MFINSVLHHSTEDVFTDSLRASLEHGPRPPISSFKSLRDVCIREVIKEVNHIHEGCVTFLEVVYEPHWQIGTWLLVKDKNSDHIVLSLYNYVQPHEDPKKIFPVGMRLALLSPYIRHSWDDMSDALLLRCDNPQYVLLYDDLDYIWDNGLSSSASGMSPSTLRVKGNKAFIRGELKRAYLFYTLALTHQDINLDLFRADKVACFSNRAEILLREERWDEAMSDAKSALSIQSNHIKAKFSFAKALSRLGRSSEAYRLVKEIIDEGEVINKSPFEKFKMECLRLTLEEGGSYDINSMLKDATSQSFLFHADFVSKNIEIGASVKSPSGTIYRGVSALCDMEEGELVTASKAFACIHESEINSRSYDKLEALCRGLLGKVVNLLSNSPCLGYKLYMLDAGGLADMNSSNSRKVDLQRIKSILDINAFSIETERTLPGMQWKEVDLIQSQLKVVKSLNGCGLWLKESLFNHSCCPNCDWMHVGKHMFIKTTRPIKKGEELCIAYTSLYGTYEERKTSFAKWANQNNGFVCACNLCHFYRTHDHIRSISEEIEYAYKRGVNSNRGSMAEAVENILPSKRRKYLIKTLGGLPLQLQHIPMVKLLLMDGIVSKGLGDHVDTLKSYQRVADIGYAVRGQDSLNYLNDLWRIVGAAIACKTFGQARESLQNIWRSRQFQMFPPEVSKGNFIHQTFLHTAIWWENEQCDGFQKAEITNLLHDVCKCRSIQSYKSTKNFMHGISETK